MSGLLVSGAQPRVSLVACPLVDSVWPFVTYGLEHACLRGGGDLNAAHLWSLCRSGHAYLVAISDGEHVIGASVWEFQLWAGKRKLKCLALYGSDMSQWLSQHRTLVEGMARAGGATAIIAEGRKGWERIFDNAKLVRQVYEVEL